MTVNSRRRLITLRDGLRLSLALPAFLGLFQGVLVLKLSCRILFAEVPSASASEVPASGEHDDTAEVPASGGHDDTAEVPASGEHDEKRPEEAPGGLPFSDSPASGERGALAAPAVSSARATSEAASARSAPGAPPPALARGDPCRRRDWGRFLGAGSVLAWRQHEQEPYSPRGPPA